MTETLLSPENQLAVEKFDLVKDLKDCVANFNALLEKAEVYKLTVKTSQQFHPLSNSIGAPRNAPLSVSITETTSY